MNPILWQPDAARIAASNLARFQRRAPGNPSAYEDLWRWSITDLAGFWAQVWDDAGIIASQPYEEVLGEPRMPGTEWFRGARLNYAENLLRRRDGTVALVGTGEGRDDETVTWADLYLRVARC
ncbi:MAG: acetoacetate--CoA ligase, partial [Euzebyales bacterium]|nr:acetoacetate--CoA ligase [Euzebyales bacterium]